MTLSLRLETSGGGQDALRAFRWSAAATVWADEVGPMVREALKAEAPVGQGPGAGRLRQAIRYARFTAGGGIRLEWADYTPYAGFVVSGTRPHVIEAKAARYLHWKSGGTDHFAKVVHHPGTKPNPFPERAIVPLKPVIEARFRSIISDALGGAL